MGKEKEFMATVTPALGGTETVLVSALNVANAKVRLEKMGYKDVHVHDPKSPPYSPHGNRQAEPQSQYTQPEPAAKLLDALPGLIGAIDKAIWDQTGQKYPFVLLVFGNGGAMHATNIDAKVALEAVQEFARATEGDAS